MIRGARFGAFGTLAFALALHGVLSTDNDQITPDEIEEHIEVLCSPELAGRSVGAPGATDAAKYITSYLSRIAGIQRDGDHGSWYQMFTLSPVFAGEAMTGLNVLAAIPGSDTSLAGEAIIIAAHYDGLPRVHDASSANGNIYPGADDNASGVAVLLEIAEAVATSATPLRRTLLLHFYSAEERGLQGSKYYIRNPSRPLSGTVAMVNVDMVGRLRGRALRIGGTATGVGLSSITQGICADSHIVLIENPNADSAGSDHLPFLDHGIPVLYVTTGVHVDHHQLTDTPDKINVVGAAEIGEVIVKLIRSIDALEGGVAFDPESRRIPPEVGSWEPRPYSGLVLETIKGPAGPVVRVASVDSASPASEAGIEAGDVIVAINDELIHDDRTIIDMMEFIGFELPSFNVVIRRRAPFRDSGTRGVARFEEWQTRMVPTVK